MLHLFEISALEGIMLLSCIAVGALIALSSIPLIINHALKKNWLDKPDHRKIHENPTPSLGGLGVFLGMTTLTIPAIFFLDFIEFTMLYSSMLVLVIMGFYDDKLDLSAKKKFLVQFVLATGATLVGLRIESLHGLFGIYELALPIQYILSILIIVLVTNAFNLIDGINGLAGGIGLINALVFGFLFAIYGDIGFSIFAFSLAGGLLGFLRYNFPKARIFLGDTGSLPLGFIMAIFGLRIIVQHPNVVGNGIIVADSLVIVGALLLLPVFDTLRVFIIRIWKKTSPFTADKNHIHHLLLKLGLTHVKASITLYAVNITFIIIAFALEQADIEWAIFGLLFSCSILAEGLTVLRYYNNNIEKKSMKAQSKELHKRNRLLLPIKE